MHELVDQVSLLLDNTPATLDIFLVKQKIMYNKVYQKVSNNKIDISDEHLKMYEQYLLLEELQVEERMTEVIAWEMEVSAHNRRVHSGNLSKLYNDIRQDLKEAKE